MDQSSQNSEAEPNDNQDENQESESGLERTRSQMKQVFTSLIGQIDKHILEVVESQSSLDGQLDCLLTTLDGIKVDDNLTDQISTNVKRIASLKSRITVCHNILNNSSDRCNRILVAASSVRQSIPPSSLCNRQTDETP